MFVCLRQAETLSFSDQSANADLWDCYRLPLLPPLTDRHDGPHFPPLAGPDNQALPVG
jgi:hypothetical protein